MSRYKENAFLYGELSDMGLKYIPTEANFILVDAGIDSTVISQRILERGIMIRSGDIWGLPHFIRLTIGTRDENQRFIMILKEILPLRS